MSEVNIAEIHRDADKKAEERYNKMNQKYTEGIEEGKRLKDEEYKEEISKEKDRLNNLAKINTPEDLCSCGNDTFYTTESGTIVCADCGTIYEV